MQQPNASRQGRIRSYFTPISHQQYLEQTRYQQQLREELQANQEEQQHLEDAARAQRKRALATERKRRQRERVKQQVHCISLCVAEIIVQPDPGA
jgi:hypothetical protein